MKQPPGHTGTAAVIHSSSPRLFRGPVRCAEHEAESDGEVKSWGTYLTAEDGVVINSQGCGPGRIGLRSSDLPLRVTSMVAHDDALQSIDAKVGAILVLVLDAYLRQTGVAKPKERTVDQMLSDVGLPVTTIAKLLGKSEQAVYLQLGKNEKKPKSNAKAKEKK
jgi:hypothetical protein